MSRLYREMVRLSATVFSEPPIIGGQGGLSSVFHKEESMPTPQISNQSPDALIVDDFRLLDARETLRCPWETEQNLLIQSVLGHAHEGHGAFRGRRFVNTTMDDICRALRLDPQTVRRQRQRLIDGVTEYAEGILSGATDGSLLVDSNNRPLLHMGSLAFLPPVDGKAVLRGFYLGGLRDDSTIRINAERRYNLAIGGGDSYMVNLAAMERAGLNADLLAHQNHDEADIESLRRSGIIVGDGGVDDKETEYLYIRHRLGCGTSDDACIVLAGLLHGWSAGVGAFLADAVDTLEKYVPVFGGKDGALALAIEKRLPDLNLTRTDVEDMAYLCADESHTVPDSSLRHLISVDRKVDQCAAEAHILFLLNRPYAPLGLSHERSLNRDLYDYCTARLQAWRNRAH